MSLAPLAEPLGHEWANDPERVNSISVDVVESVDEAYTVANRETSALAASIVTEDSDAAEAFLTATAAPRRSGRRQPVSPTAPP